MRLPIYQVDAFTADLFSGNPAAVVPLQKWLTPKTMQQIALENNLSETAFFVQKGEQAFELRWFTPTVEVELCGHATLAGAHVLFNHLGFQLPQITFESLSGNLTVTQKDDLILLNFPARHPAPVKDDEKIRNALGMQPAGLFKDLNYLAVFESAAEVIDFKPDFDKLARIDDAGIIITAPGNGKDFDFVSRYFAAYAGIPEDSVTGSAHCTLAPYWAKRLGKDRLTARQASARGGTLYCRNLGERVEIGGRAVTYLTGEINIPAEV